MGQASLKAKPAQIGDERWLVEMIATDRVEAMAREQGWPGGDEGLREFCEPDDAAVHAVHATKEAAFAAARQWLASGKSFFGCSIVDRQVYEVWQDDRGNRVKHADWETRESHEIAMDGEAIQVDR